jgi:2'-5' RNA ligase
MQLTFQFDAQEGAPLAGVVLPKARLPFSHGRRSGAPAGAGNRVDRYFFAVLPDEESAIRIQEVALEGCEPSAGPSVELVKTMVQAADTISAGGFAVCFDQVMSFSPKAGMYPLVLSSSDEMPALSALHGGLRRAMLARGFQGRCTFTPHLTVLYDRRIVAATGLHPIRWTVRDFVLIHSFTGHTRYEQLGRWPLNRAGSEAV